jgi:hypothetical protein
MSGFTDQTMIRFLDDSFTSDFLTNRIGAAALFNAAYNPVDFTPQGIKVSRVLGREFESPTFETIRSSGSDEKLTTSERVLTERSFRNHGRLVWVEVAVSAILAVIAQSTVMEPDNIITQNLLTNLGGASTIDELKTKLLAQFTQSQVDAMFAKLRITTITEFKERMNSIVQFNYKAPPAFDPNDPTNAKNFPVTICVKFQADLNVSDALQNAKLCRSVRERENSTQPVVEGAEVKTNFVFVTVFPDSVVVDNAIPGLTAAQIRTNVQNLFAAEGMLAHFFVG